MTDQDIKGIKRLLGEKDWYDSATAVVMRDDVDKSRLIVIKKAQEELLAKLTMLYTTHCLGGIAKIKVPNSSNIKLKVTDTYNSNIKLKVADTYPNMEGRLNLVGLLFKSKVIDSEIQRGLKEYPILDYYPFFNSVDQIVVCYNHCQEMVCLYSKCFTLSLYYRLESFTALRLRRSLIRFEKAKLSFLKRIRAIFLNRIQECKIEKAVLNSQLSESARIRFSSESGIDNNLNKKRVITDWPIMGSNQKYGIDLPLKVLDTGLYDQDYKLEEKYLYD